MKVLLSAGPTVEPIDPVRFISNRSSGAMAVAIATELLDRGHEIVVAHGPLTVAVPGRGTWRGVQTAVEMLAELETHAEWCEVFIMAAAVCDVRPAFRSGEKLAKSSLTNIELEPNPDIARILAIGKRSDQLMICFSLENQLDFVRPLEKMRSKGADWVVVNDLESMGGGQGTFAIMRADGAVIFGPQALSKKEFAARLVTLVEAR